MMTPHQQQKVLQDMTNAELFFLASRYLNDQKRELQNLYQEAAEGNREPFLQKVFSLLVGGTATSISKDE